MKSEESPLTTSPAFTSAIAPNGVRVKLVHLTATGNRPWNGHRDPAVRDGWSWLILAPAGQVLADVWIGTEPPYADDPEASTEERKADRKAREAARELLADAAAGLYAFAFDPDELVPYSATDVGTGFAAEPGVPRFGADNPDMIETDR